MEGWGHRGKRVMVDVSLGEGIFIRAVGCRARVLGYSCGRGRARTSEAFVLGPCWSGVLYQCGYIATGGQGYGLGLWGVGVEDFGFPVWCLGVSDNRSRVGVRDEVRCAISVAMGVGLRSGI